MSSNPRLHLHDDDVTGPLSTIGSDTSTSCLLDNAEARTAHAALGFTIAPPAAPSERSELREQDDAPEGASIFAIGRRGELRWCTPSAQRDLKQIGARHHRRAGRLTPEWAYLLWKPIHPHRLEYQVAALDAESLPCRGRVAWSPRRPLELTVSIWRLRPSSVEPDPTWRRLMRELRGDDHDGDDRPAA